MNVSALSADGPVLGGPEFSANEGKHFFDEPRAIAWCIDMIVPDSLIGVGQSQDESEALPAKKRDIKCKYMIRCRISRMDVQKIGHRNDHME